MRPFWRRPRAVSEPPLLRQSVLDDGGYQEVTAGTIPVRAVLGLAAGSKPSSVIAQHERGYLIAFDEHLDKVRDGDAPDEDVDYEATWAVVSGSDDKPAVIRLELRVKGLTCRPRLAFTGPDITPLWLLCDGAQLMINIDPPTDRQALPFALSWGLGAVPGTDALAHLLTLIDARRPPPLPA